MNSAGTTAPMTPKKIEVLDLLRQYRERFGGQRPDPDLFIHMTEEEFADGLRVAIASGKPIEPKPQPPPGESQE